MYKNSWFSFQFEKPWLDQSHNNEFYIQFLTTEDFIDSTTNIQFFDKAQLLVIEYRNSQI